MTSATVVHAIPGRVRLRIPEMRANPVMAADVSARLARIPGVCGVETNVVVGSVVVRFDAAGPGASDHLNALKGTFPTIDTASVGNGNGNRHGNGVGFHPDRQVADLLRSLNDGVGAATNGFDLKLLLPLALFALGIRSLVVSDRLPIPSWYDYLWFGLSTFVMMNAAAFASPGEPSPPVV